MDAAEASVAEHHHHVASPGVLPKMVYYGIRIG